MEISVLGLKHHLSAWHPASGLHIVIYFIVETAFQLGAHARKFLRIERYVLESCGVCAHTDEVLHPRGTAQLASARACSTNTSSLLSRTNLLHLNPYVECVGKYLDELSEIHTLVSDIVEYGLVAVALIFHVTDFHLKSKVFSYLSALNHCAMLTSFGFIILVHVCWTGYTVYALDVISRLEVGFLYLQLH